MTPNLTPPSSSRLEQMAEAAASGLLPNELELQIATEYIAAKRFSPTLTRAGGRLAGVRWNNAVLRGGDMLSNAEAHYLRHCVVVNEWPARTTLLEYVASLSSVIRNPDTGVFVSRLFGEWQIGFVGEAGDWRGPQGNRWVLVEYRCSVDGWVTGFQPKEGLSALVSPNRSVRTWLKRL